jgi:hypothetical protein
MIRRSVAVVLCGIFMLSACAAEDRTQVRKLVELDESELKVAAYDDQSLQDRLERLVEEVGPIAARYGGWSSLNTDMINPEILDLVLIGGASETLNYGYGTEAASMLTGPDYVIFAMAGDSGSCWAVRVSGSTDAPEILRGNIFAPNCSAEKLSSHRADVCSEPATCPESTVANANGALWFSLWPPTASPADTGPDGLEVGAPPTPAG